MLQEGAWELGRFKIHIKDIFDGIRMSVAVILFKDHLVVDKQPGRSPAGTHPQAPLSPDLSPSGLPGVSC